MKKLTQSKTRKKVTKRRVRSETSRKPENFGKIQHIIAIEQLRSGIPVGEVAYNLGYKDVGSFSRTFKRREGISPFEFNQTA